MPDIILAGSEDCDVTANFQLRCLHTGVISKRESVRGARIPSPTQRAGKPYAARVLKITNGVHSLIVLYDNVLRLWVRRGKTQRFRNLLRPSHKSPRPRNNGGGSGPRNKKAGVSPALTPATENRPPETVAS